MENEFKFLDDLTFGCFNCKKESRFSYESGKRDTAKRFGPDRNPNETVQFICEHCGMANDIKLSLKDGAALLSRISSSDPDIKKAINQAQKGDYKGLIDEARKRFKF